MSHKKLPFLFQHVQDFELRNLFTPYIQGISNKMTRPCYEYILLDLARLIRITFLVDIRLLHLEPEDVPNEVSTQKPKTTYNSSCNGYDDMQKKKTVCVLGGIREKLIIELFTPCFERREFQKENQLTMKEFSLYYIYSRYE